MADMSGSTGPDVEKVREAVDMAVRVLGLYEDGRVNISRGAGGN